MDRFREESCAETNPRDEFRAVFVMPDAITGAVESAIFVGPILIMVLAVSSIGAEYGLGTLRTTLTRGTGRWQLLSSRLVLLVLVAAAGLLVVGAAAAVGSVVAAVIPPGEDGGIADSGKWSDAAIMFGKAVYALAPYVELGIFLAVLTQSTGTGLAASLGYYVVELIVVPIIGNYERVEWVRDLVLGPQREPVDPERFRRGGPRWKRLGGGKPAGRPAVVPGDPGVHCRPGRRRVLALSAQGRERRQGRLTGATPCRPERSEGPGAGAFRPERPAPPRAPHSVRRDNSAAFG